MAVAQRLRLFGITFLGVAFLLAAGAGATGESASQNITVTPASTLLSVAPGGSVSNHFDVINEGKAGFSVTASVSPYHVKGVTYDPQFTPLPGTVDASQWVHIALPVTQHVAPLKLTSYNYTVAVPAGTAPGGYYAILFAVSTPDNAGSNGVVLHNRVGDILYITVTGPVRSSGFVTASHIPHLVIGSGTTLGLLVGNNGGIHFQTSTHIAVTNTFGKTVYRFLSQRIVLPSTQRLISTDWATKAPLGIYHVSRSSSLPGGTKQLATTTIIVVQPWLAVLIIILIFVLVAFLIRLLLRWISRHRG